MAERHGIPVLQFERVRRPEAQEALRRLTPELQVVVAFGQILPRAVIDIAPRGTVNVHASLLPRLRGAAPIQWAIANGDTETGVTTMQIDEGLDTGSLLLSRSLAIAPEETAAELEPRLARLGGELLVETLAGLESGTLTAVPQDPARATLAPLLRKEDGRVDWTLPARAIACRARGFYPWPGSYTQHDGRLLKLIRVRERPDGHQCLDVGVGSECRELRGVELCRVAAHDVAECPVDRHAEAIGPAAGAIDARAVAEQDDPAAGRVDPPSGAGRCRRCRSSGRSWIGGHGRRRDERTNERGDEEQGGKGRDALHRGAPGHDRR